MTPLLHKRYLCATAMNIPKKLVKASVSLPSTSYEVFVRSADRSKLDRELSSQCRLGQQLYDWQRNREADEQFTLLDGPPYANGSVHAGHAVNKILKDIFCRFKAMTGKKVNFTPGWDCHGLPIELKATRRQHQRLEPSEVIALCGKLATAAIDNQKTSFESWGVSSDWRSPYLTHDMDYVGKQLLAFHDLYEKGLVYRSFKPVYWSPSSRTALARAELEYNDSHQSQSLYVKFPVDGTCDLFAVIWTTTPWTIPLNDVILFSPSVSYVVVQPSRFRHERWIIAHSQVAVLEAEWDMRLDVVSEFTFDLSSHVRYRNPLFLNTELTAEQRNRFHSADFVSTEVGTGLVHGSFCHGTEDFKISERLGCVPTKCYVDDDGLYDSTFDIPELRGKSILAAGNEAAISMLEPFTVKRQPYTHSYPYDWRTKEPVILKASNQWFIDCPKLRERAMELLGDVKFSPESARRRMEIQVTSQPAWCISRQRIWGVPVPVFYDENDAPVVDRRLTSHVIRCLSESGLEAWWNGTVSDVPAAVKTEVAPQAQTLRPGKDIMDVWLDSGLAWLCSAETPVKADLVLEGHDQFRGWLSTMLFTSVALQDDVPFKAVAVHGFAVDHKGDKMSKSVGNVISPSQISDETYDFTAFDPKLKSVVLGLDGLRYWVAHFGMGTAVYVGNEVFKNVFSRIKQLRVIVKFILGSTSDMGGLLPYDQLFELDRWLLHRTALFVKDCESHYNDYDIQSVTHAVTSFVEETLSATYVASVKDRLYCSPKDGTSRSAAQTALTLCLEALLSVLSPILPHLTEETCSFRNLQPGEVFERGWPKILNDRLQNPTLFEELLPIRKNLMLEFGSHTNLVDKVCHITAPESQYQRLLAMNHSETSSRFSELCDFLGCSTVVVEASSTTDISVSISDTSLPKCDRCRRYVRDHGEEFCPQCTAVLVSLYPKRAVLEKS